ncbi:MAG: hypothetical protein Q4G33_15045 [bacterium]|nr:hypothetical protein [bacterium]
MNDVYMEYMVKHKKDTKSKTAVIGIYILAGLLTIVMCMLIMFGAYALAGTGISQFSFSIGLVLIVFMWYFAVFFAKKFDIEYEYILTNSSLDIDKIMSKSQRKRVVSLDFTEIEVCANIKDDTHNSAYKRGNDGFKLYDMTGDIDDGGVYFVDFSNEGTRCRVLFQPTSRMIEAIRRFNPRNIFVYEDRF